MKTQKGITKNIRFNAKANLLPRFVLDVIWDEKTAIAFVQPQEIFNFLIAPVIQVNKQYHLKQEVRDGWDRVIKDIDYKDIKLGSKILLVSPQNNWNIHENKISIIETANIIDGANYLNYLVSNNIPQKIPMLILFNATDSDELVYRRNIHKTQSFSFFDIKNKVGSEAPRLVIDEKWKHIKIVSDPFVVLTSRGYVAVVHVIDKSNDSINHVIVSAKSISSELESIRIKLGTLVGVELKLRKQSPEPQSLYEIFLI